MKLFLFSIVIVCGLVGCKDPKAAKTKAAEVEEKIAAHEAGAINSLRTMNSSQAMFLETGGTSKYGSLEELAKKGLIDEVLGKGTKEGYKFKIHLGDAKGENKEYQYHVTAEPIKPGESGKRYFFTDQSGMVYFSDKGPATNKSTAIK